MIGLGRSHIHSDPRTGAACPRPPSFLVTAGCGARVAEPSTPNQTAAQGWTFDRGGPQFGLLPTHECNLDPTRQRDHL